MKWIGALVAAAALLGLVYLATGGRAFPAMDTPGDRASQVAGELMSPFCPGRTLAACPSGAAAEVREEIADRLEKGESRDSIERDLLARFGDEIRGAPEASGIGLLAWIAPAGIGLVLLIGVLWMARRMRSAGGDGAGRPSPAPLDPRMAERLEDELEQLG